MTHYDIRNPEKAIKTHGEFDSEMAEELGGASRQIDLLRKQLLDYEVYKQMYSSPLREIFLM